ncbi:unnamed protein product, partial [Choristocarpus tenellus]
SRLCQTCTASLNKPCVYCDVCFFNSHPDLDPLAPSHNGLLSLTDRPGQRRQNRADHRWSPLVVMCVECKRYAARWLCDECEEVYCHSCYSFIHSHGTKIRHGAERLPYYTADMHMNYGLFCQKRQKKRKAEEVLHGREIACQESRHAAAVVIQAGWRGMKGRIEGRAFLKAKRREIRLAWRQRRRDDRVRRAWWFFILDL